MRKFCKASLAFFAAAYFGGASIAQATVYNVDIVSEGNSVIGTLTTDGKIGSLALGDITDWSLTAGVGALYNTYTGPLSGSGSNVFGSNTSASLSATPSGLYWDFGVSSTQLAFANDGGMLSFLGTGWSPPNPIDIIYEQTGFTRGSINETGNFQIAAVPEPSTWAMLLIGFAGIGFAGYRKRQRVSSITVR